MSALIGLAEKKTNTVESLETEKNRNDHVLLLKLETDREVTIESGKEFQILTIRSVKKVFISLINNREFS